MCLFRVGLTIKCGVTVLAYRGIHNSKIVGRGTKMDYYSLLLYVCSRLYSVLNRMVQGNDKQ